MAPIVAVFLLALGLARAQDDFTVSIKCYTCKGAAVNSTCADPVDPEKLGFKTCENGVCLKWTVYRDKELQMIRTCSSDLNFHLTMIDGVCRTERNGNGDLCMCGKHLCNSAPPSTHTHAGVTHWPGLVTLVFLSCTAWLPHRWI